MFDLTPWCISVGPVGQKESWNVMIKTRSRIKALRVSFIAAAMMMAASATSFAGPLNLALDTPPEIDVRSITSIFNNGLFTATGTAWQYIDDAGPHVLTQAFKLTANFTNGAPTSASLVIGSEAAPVVYAGNLINFAYSAVKGGTIEFLFGTNGGSMGAFTPGGQLDVAITVSSTFTPQFTTGWMNSLETAVIREPAVPEPSSLLLMLAGAAGVYGSRRKIFGLSA